jgi:SAM-dependent methyltransferase
VDSRDTMTLRHGTVQHPFLAQWFQEDVGRIERQIASTAPADIPGLFKDMPLDVFALLLLEPLREYPNLRAFLPRMPDEELQRSWTGDSNVLLLTAAARFVEKVVAAYVKHTGRAIRDAVILDHGSGWGRVARVFTKVVPTTQIYGVDASPDILEVNRELGVKGTYGLIDEYPSRLPFDRRFDLIWAFSLFTHLSEKAHRCALSLWRDHLAPGGLVAVTVRPRHYWEYCQHPSAADLLRTHDEEGFAFVPDELPPDASGDVFFGQTSISPEYVTSRWSDWTLVGTDISNYDSMQVILYLQAK